MKAKKYTLTYNVEGKEVSEQNNRPFTHALQVKYQGANEAKVISLSSSRELAEKAAKAHVSWCASGPDPVEVDVHIIPVTVTENK